MSWLKCLAVPGVLYKKIYSWKVDWKEKCDSKRCTSHWDDCNLDRIVKQTESGAQGSFIGSGLRLASAHKKQLMQRCVRKMGCKCYIPSVKPHHPCCSSRYNIRSVLPGLREKKKQDRCSMVQSLLSRTEVLHFTWKSKFQNLIQRGKESKLLLLQCEASTVSVNLGCHVIHWCWSTD